MALQRAADSLLTVAGEARPSIAHRKLYEYLAAGRLILVLGQRSAAAAIARDARGGIVAPADDREAILAALIRLLDSSPGQTVEGAPAEAVEPYSYAHIMRGYAEVLEGATAARELASLR